MSNDEGQEMVELKHMVMSFRVSELQVLLGSAGRNKSGRKHDLLSRALQLLKNGCNSQVQQRIRELYQRRFPRSKTVNPMPFSMPNDTMDTDYRYEKDKKKHSNDYSRTSAPPVHPDVKFKSLPFYDVLSDVVKPSSLITHGQRECSKVTFTFSLSEEQVRLIKESQVKDAMRKRYQIQVQMRFCLLETTCDQKDFLPPNLCVQVNKMVVQLPPFVPPSKAGIEPKRANRPFDITSTCRLCDVYQNKLEISWLSERGKNFACSINVVQPVSADTLLQRLRRKGIRNSGHSEALIKEKLTRDPDSEIATTSLKVSLLCPLGKMRMTVPARPITCTHMQCFDAMLFLQMNERKPTWICPVCDKPSEFSLLFIDGLFMDILNATTSEEIIFLDDGRWEPVKPKTECLSLCTPSKSSNDKNFSIALDLSSSPNSSPKTNGSSKQKTIDIIDLTCDTSDDEEAPTPVSKRVGQEQDDIHSLSSTSPYRSETPSVHRDDGPPPAKQRRTPQEIWDPTRPSAAMPSGIFSSSANPSPRPSSYGNSDSSDRTTLPSNYGLHPGFPLSHSRDNTPPLNPMSALLNSGSLTGYSSQLDYPVDLNFLLPFDNLRRMAGDHSARSSPYLLNSTGSNPLFPVPPSSRSSANDHISRNYMTSYPSNPYHTFSPLPYLQPQDNSDVIPID